MLDFYSFPETLLKKAAQIKLLILDVDGVLTDGSLGLSNDLVSHKAFHVRDGFGIRQIIKEKILTAVITGRSSKLVAERARELKIDFLFQNQPDKLPVFNTLIQQLAISPQAVAYMGDDLIDLPVIKQVGLSAAPADGYPFVRSHVDFVSNLPGGKGAVREFCDLILAGKNRLIPICEQFLKNGDELPPDQVFKLN